VDVRLVFHLPCAAVPIPFAPFFGLALGAALAWIAGPALARDEGPIVASRSFAIVMAFAGFVWLPAIGYFVAFHGDWSYLYMVPWRRVPSAIDLGLVLLAGAAVVGSFWLTADPVKRRRFGPVIALIVTPGALAIGGLTLSAKRLAVSGTFAQFHGDFGTQPIGASPLGKGVLIMGIVVVLGVAWTVRWLSFLGDEGQRD
jgi:hypothetical protein